VIDRLTFVFVWAVCIAACILLWVALIRWLVTV